MTKHIDKFGFLSRTSLARMPWPIEPPVSTAVRAWIDIHAACSAWQAAGRGVYRVRPDERSPALPPDLDLASAPLRRAAQAYVLDGDQCIVLARIARGQPIPISADRSICISPRGAVLVYCTPSAAKAVDSGYINLVDQPTPSRLRLGRGGAVGEIYTAPLSDDQMGDIGLLLSRVLPLFFSTP